MKPPLKLKPLSFGKSKEIGIPLMKNAMIGRPTIRPTQVQKTGKICPVAIWRAFAQRWMNMIAPMATTRATRTSHAPSSKIGFGA